MHISLLFLEKAKCELFCKFRLAYWGQRFLAWMPTFASLSRCGPGRKNELLHLLWCAKVRMYNSIHWTTCAPLSSASNYFTAAGYSFFSQNIYKCQTTWKRGHAYMGAHGENCIERQWAKEVKQKKWKMCWLRVLWVNVTWSILRAYFFLAVHLKHRCVAGICTGHHSPIIMQGPNNKGNQRHLQWLGYMTLVCHS